MKLPGGVWREGRLHRDVAFRPMDGHLEMAVAEAAGALRDLPGRVSAALQAALAEVGALGINRELVDTLSVGDRQFLVSQLAGHLGLETAWLSATCRHCHELFDFPLDYRAVPIKPAGEGYPFAEVTVSTGRIRVRVPTGADQRAILSCPDEYGATRELARRCIVGEPVALTDEDITRIETALEVLAPELATHVAASCPECGSDNVLEFDPYYFLGQVGNELFVDIHHLAAHYHWSESEILGLPRWRRKKYLGLIDLARGMAT